MEGHIHGAAALDAGAGALEAGGPAGPLTRRVRELRRSVPSGARPRNTTSNRPACRKTKRGPIGAGPPVDSL